MYSSDLLRAYATAQAIAAAQTPAPLAVGARYLLAGRHGEEARTMLRSPKLLRTLTMMSRAWALSSTTSTWIGRSSLARRLISAGRSIWAASARMLATLDLLVKENMVEQVKAMAPHFENAVHSLKGVKHVTDIRNFGLAAGITLEAMPGEPARRPYEVAMAMLKKGFYVRYGGDTIQLAPPFITTSTQIDSLIDALGESLNAS